MAAKNKVFDFIDIITNEGHPAYKYHWQRFLFTNKFSSCRKYDQVFQVRSDYFGKTGNFETETGKNEGL